MAITDKIISNKEWVNWANRIWSKYFHVHKPYIGTDTDFVCSCGKIIKINSKEK